MTWLLQASLMAAAWWQLLRFDLACWVQRAPALVLPAPRRRRTGSAAAGQDDVVRAVELATCLYIKPVRCLQRAVCLVRMLRAAGVPARLVIGYRWQPFCSHAWAEVDGVVVSDSPAYRDRLQVLFTS